MYIHADQPSPGTQQNVGHAVASYALTNDHWAWPYLVNLGFHVHLNCWHFHPYILADQR